MTWFNGIIESVEIRRSPKGTDYVLVALPGQRIYVFENHEAVYQDLKQWQGKKLRVQANKMEGGNYLVYRGHIDPRQEELFLGVRRK